MITHHLVKKDSLWSKYNIRHCTLCGKKLARQPSKTGLCVSCKNKKYLPHLNKKSPNVTGDKNKKWKGDAVGYRNIHAWVQRQLGKANKCSKNLSHKATTFHWANVSGDYKRDLSDWRELCPKCNFSDGVKMHQRYKEVRVII